MIIILIPFCAAFAFHENYIRFYDSHMLKIGHWTHTIKIGLPLELLSIMEALASMADLFGDLSSLLRNSPGAAHDCSRIYITVHGGSLSHRGGRALQLGLLLLLLPRAVA